jgi:hypothetical protein
MRSGTVLMGVCGLLFAAHAAVAQDVAADAKMKRVEVTTFASMVNSAQGIGAAVRWPLPGKLNAELEMGQRYSEINALSSNLSLLYDLPTVGIVRPYVGGGGGIGQYGYLATGYTLGPSGPVPVTGTARTTTIAANAGGGVRVPISNAWGVRVDARWFNGLGRRAPEHLRLFAGVTFARGKS